MSWKQSIRVIADFGTTASGFTYSHISNDELYTNDKWPGEIGQLKTCTVLQYDEKYEKVESWGHSALAKRYNRKRERNVNQRPVELFKLHLGENLLKKPALKVDYKKAITDYLTEIGKLMQEKITSRWPNVNYKKDVLHIVTVPAEYSEQSKAIMRECIYQAGLLEDLDTIRLQFTTEPEAAAIYCMKNTLKEHLIYEPGTTFMIVDCGGGTVDLTTRKLHSEDQLGEITERSEYICKNFGNNTINLLKEKHYGQLQYLVQTFCRHVKLPFTGQELDFHYELDVEEVCPILKQYASGSVKDELEENEWIIELDYDTIKSFFDPIIDRIISMIQSQLITSKEKCLAMFLVGGFSQSKYLQSRIKQEFSTKVGFISVPSNPVAAVVKGACLYGISMVTSEEDKLEGLKFVVKSRRLKYTYGIKVFYEWKKGDPIERKDSSNSISKFYKLAERNTEVKIDQEFSMTFYPRHATQTYISFLIFTTTQHNIEYCDDPSAKLLGKLNISLPYDNLGKDRPVSFSLRFAAMEIIAKAKNLTNSQNYSTTFELNFD
nr:12309_t:CDS:2 [Entrophospora candida]